MDDDDVPVYAPTKEEMAIAKAINEKSVALAHELQDGRISKESYRRQMQDLGYKDWAIDNLIAVAERFYFER